MKKKLQNYLQCINITYMKRHHFIITKIVIFILLLFYNTTILSQDYQKVEYITKGIEHIHKNQFNMGILYLNLGLNSSNIPDSIKNIGIFYKQCTYYHTNSPHYSEEELYAAINKIDFSKIEIPKCDIYNIANYKIGSWYEKNEEYDSAYKYYDNEIKQYNKDEMALKYYIALGDKARMLFMQKKYDDAIKLYSEILSNDHLFDIETKSGFLSLYSLCYFQKKDYKNALLINKKHRDFIKNSIGINSIEYIYALSDLYTISIESTDYPNAIDIAKEILQIYEQIPEFTEEAHCNYQLLLATAYFYNENLNEAIELYETIFESSSGSLWYECATQLSNAYFSTDSYKKALNLTDSIIKFVEIEYGKQSIEYIKALGELVYQMSYSNTSVNTDIENFTTKLHKEIIETKIDNNNASEDIGLLYTIAQSYLALGYTTEHDSILNNRLEVIKSIYGEKHPFYITELCNVLSNTYTTDLNKNIIFIKQLEERYLQDTANYQIAIHKDILHSLSNLYQKQNNYIKAIDILNRSIDMSKMQGDTLNQSYIDEINSIAVLYNESGFNDKYTEFKDIILDLTKKLYGESSYKYQIQKLDKLDILSQTKPNDAIVELLDIIDSNVSTDYFILYTITAKTYYSLGDYDNAEKYINISFNSAVIPTQKALANTIKAQINAKKGDFQTAIKYQKEALSIAEKYIPVKLKDISDDLALYYFENKDYNNSFEILHNNINKEWNSYTDNLLLMSEYEREKYWTKNGTIHNYIHAFIPQDELNKQSKFSMLIYEALLIRKNLQLRIHNSIIKNIYKNKHKKNEYQEYVSLKNNSKHLIKEGLNKLEELEKKLYADLNIEIPTINIKDLQANISPNDVLIEFSEYTNIHNNDSLFSATILKKDWKYPITLKMEINKNSSIENNRLYNIVWEPLLKHLDFNSNIYFSAAGKLHQIPIESLPIRDGKIMSDAYNMYRLSSTRELALKKEPAKYKKAVLYGGLNYNMTNEAMLTENAKYQTDSTYTLFASRGLLEDSIRGYKWTNLNNTKMEVEYISEQMQQNGISTKVFQGNEGSEESFKALSGKGYNIIHIATHGFFFPEPEAKRKDYFQPIMLSDDLGRNYAPADLSLFRTGLVLSGGNRAWQGDSIPDHVEDGILTANEIKDLDLRGADLVVLSACNTGQGEITSEGVFGLQRAFKMAGAQTIIMSLTEVDDQTTMAMMNKLYSNLMEGQSKHDAFYNAQRYIRSIKPDPKYWRGWIMLD